MCITRDTTLLRLTVPTRGSQEAVAGEPLADGFRVEAKLNERFMVQDLAAIKYKGWLLHHLMHLLVIIGL